MKRLFVLGFFIVFHGTAIAKEDKNSLSNLLNTVRGDFFNIVVLPPHSTKSSMVQTNKAIEKGFSNQLDILARIIRRKDYSMTLKRPAADAYVPNTVSLSSKSQEVVKKEKRATTRLEKALREATVWIQQNSDKGATKAKSTGGTNPEEMSFDQENFQDVAEAFQEGKEKAEEINNFFKEALIDIGGIYRPSQKHKIEGVSDVEFPYVARQKQERVVKDWVRPHGLYAEAFFPTTEGRRHTLSLEIFFVTINRTEDDIRVMRKPVDEFVWHRNPRFVSAVTGEVLREVISGTTGKTLK